MEKSENEKYLWITNPVSTKLESTEEYKRFFQRFKTCGCTSLCHGVWTVVFVFQLFTRFVLWWKSDNLGQTLSRSNHKATELVMIDKTHGKCHRKKN